MQKVNFAYVLRYIYLYFILTIKENCQTNSCRKFQKQIELYSFFIDILAFEWANYAQGREFCFVFFDPGAGVCIEKLSLGRGFRRKKLVTRGSARMGW